MKFDLTKPCPKCPFRSDVPGYLRGGRAAEIAGSVFARGESFPCHQTVDYDNDGAGEVRHDSQMCAGAMILAEHVEKPTQMMRIAERLGMYDRTRMKMSAPVFRSITAFISHHARGRT